MSIVAAAALHGVAALVILAALSMVGFAAMPASIRPGRAALAIPASLAAGTLAVGWCSWIAGTFIGTAAIVPLFAIAAIASLVRAREWARNARRCFALIIKLAKANPVATIVIALLVIASLPQLLLPLVDSDGLAYHVALPKLFLLTGHVWYVPWTFAGALPQTLEMIYLVALRVAGGETAKFIHFGFFLASLGTLAVATYRPRMRSAAMLAPMLYAAAPVVLAPASAAFTDHAAVFCVIAATLLLFRRSSLVSAGIALGAAVAIKVTVAPAVAGLVIWTIVARRRFLPLFVPVVVAFLPYGIRNVAHTGDPIFPISYIALHRPVPGIPAQRVAYASEFHSRVPGALGIAWLQGRADVQPDEVAGLHHALGLFAIALAIWFRWSRRWLALVLPPLALALLFHPPTRLLLPMFIGLAPLEAYALVIIAKRWATPIAIVAAAPALIASITVTLTAFRPADLLLGRVDRTQFLATRVPGFRASELVNRQPPGGWVMALDFPAPYYFDRPWIAEGILNVPPLRQWIADAGTADDVLRRLRDANVRYIVVTPGYGGGTRASLLPLAENPREAAIIVELRRHLVLMQTLDHTDVLELPAHPAE